MDGVAEEREGGGEGGAGKWGRRGTGEWKTKAARVPHQRQRAGREGGREGGRLERASCAMLCCARDGWVDGRWETGDGRREVVGGD